MDLAPLRDLAAALAADWRAVADGVSFASRDVPLLAAAALAGVALVVLAVRLLGGRRVERETVTVPALLAPIRGSRLAWIRHAPLVLAAAGLPLALLALADPYTALVSQTVSYPASP